MNRIAALSIFFAAIPLGGGAELNLMPLPANAAPQPGRLPVDETFSVAIAGYDEPRLHGAATRMLRRLALQTGLPIGETLQSDAAAATLAIHCAGAGEAVQKLAEDESYRLRVDSGQARLDAPNPLGVLRGLETFLQLVAADSKGFMAPAIVIADKPRFPWRGLHLDVSRHWMPIEVVKRNLDGMAAVKLNVFHWHLSDDQGFRIECRRFPDLHGKGSDGLFYTQEQARDVIAYARERGIRVVPEFDMPGHSTSWFLGYPELASAPGPYRIERRWGVIDAVMDPTRESTYDFLDAFIGEMAALFPDEYFHIGGDEVNGRHWTRSPEIQAFLRQRGLKDNHALQAYFNRRIQAIVTKHGKRMEGWDEILNPDLPKDIVIQSWRGQKSLAEAARMGYRGILSSGYYLDYMLPAAAHYQTDPLEKESAGLDAAEKARILGGEAAMWAEYVDPENVDSRIWPRTAAIAERLWSPQEVKDVASMYRRLELVSRELEWAGLTHRSNYHSMLNRLAGSDPAEPLQVFAGAVEPVKFYGREKARRYTQQTPLNRLVDAVPPESARARQFAALAERWMDREARAALRAALAAWRDNDAKLQPALQKSFLLAEDAPLSRDLSHLAAIGLRALDYLDSGQPAPAAWAAEQRAFLAQAAKPRAELLLVITPSIERLVAAAAK